MKLILTILFCLISIQAWATTYTLATSGANWSANSTWSPNTGHPVAGDTVIIPSGVPASVVVDVPSACAYLTFNAAKLITVNANLTISADLTLNNADTFNGSAIVYVGGSIINTTRGSIAGTAPFVLNGTGTIAGVSWNNNLTINTAGTITFKSGDTTGIGLTGGRTYTYTAGTVVSTGHILNIFSVGGGTTYNMAGITWETCSFGIDSTLVLASNLNCTNLYGETSTLLFSSYAVTFSGNYDINCANLYLYKNYATANASLTLVAGRTLTVSNSITSLGSAKGSPVLVSSATGSSKTNIVYQGTMENLMVVNTTFTDIAYTGVPLYAWYSAVPVRSTGIKNATGKNIGGGGVLISNF